MSSSINALVAVTVEDFILPVRKNLTEKQVRWMNMGLSKLYMWNKKNPFKVALGYRPRILWMKEWETTAKEKAFFFVSFSVVNKQNLSNSS